MVTRKPPKRTPPKKPAGKVSTSRRSAEFKIYLRSSEKHPKQDAIVDCPIKRIIIRAGRRGGKTVSAAKRAVKRFLLGRRQLYGAPTSDQVKKFWEEVKRALRDPIAAGIFVKNETDKTITLPGTDQRIRAKTAWNADTLRGDYADDLYLDEWQLMNEDAWERVGAPMLLDNDGDAVFIYTPPSLITRSVTKAQDPLHASKMFKTALAEMQAAEEEGRTSRWMAIHFSSHANPYISKTALNEISKDMTTLAIRQEIEAEDVEEMPGALWKLIDIERFRVGALVEHSGKIIQVPTSWARLGVGVDPSGGVNEIGIIGGGTATCDCKGYPELHGFILDDASLKGSPNVWGNAVVTCYNKIKADRIYGEKNFGGDMVEANIKTADSNVRYENVNASRGKAVRADPVSALYEKGMIHHVGRFDKLENEMVTWVPGVSKWSPNRLDACVWVLSRLLVAIPRGDSSWSPPSIQPIFGGFKTKVL